VAPPPAWLRRPCLALTEAEDGAMRMAMLRQGRTPVRSTPADLAAPVARDAPRGAALIRASGAKVERGR
jgi:hypothetical protein